MINVLIVPSRLLAAAALCLVSASAVRAQARIEDCEKIQAADAYNQCLAKFGPTSKVKSVEPVKPGDIKDSGADAAASAGGGGAMPGGGPGAKPSRHALRGHGSRGRHATRGTRRGGKSSVKSSGRKRMTFTIKRRR